MTLIEQINRFVDANPGLTPAQISEQTGIELKRVGTALAFMLRKGRVSRTRIECKIRTNVGAWSYSSIKPKDKWFSCPFCGEGGLTSEYDSSGTTLTCVDGCHGSFTFPAFESEVLGMWTRARAKDSK